MALINESPAVKLAQGELELAQKQLEVVSSPVQGELSGGYSQTWSELSVPDEAGERISESDSDGDWEPLNLDASFNVVPFGPSYEAQLRARWALTNAENALRDARYTGVIEVTTLFQTALVATLEAQVGTLSLNLAEQTLADAQTRLAAEAATNAEVQAAELSVQQAQITVTNLEARVAQTLSELSVNLGIPVARLRAGLPPLKLSLDINTELERRSDIIAAGLAVQDARISRDATRRDYLPSGNLNLGYSVTQEGSSVSVGGAYDTRSFQPSANLSYDPDFELDERVPDGQRANSFRLGLSATIPLDVAVGSALAAGRISIEQSEAQLKRTTELARLDVETQQLSVDNALTALELAQAAAQQQEDALSTAQTRFDNGIVSPLELLSAQVDLAQSELELKNAQHTLRLAQMGLLSSLAINPLEVY